MPRTGNEHQKKHHNTLSHPTTGRHKPPPDIYITQGQAKSNSSIVKKLSDSETFQSVFVPSKRRGRFVADESRSRQAPVRPWRLRCFLPKKRRKIMFNLMVIL